MFWPDDAPDDAQTRENFVSRWTGRRPAARESCESAETCCDVAAVDVAAVMRSLDVDAAVAAADSAQTLPLPHPGS